MEKSELEIAGCLRRLLRNRYILRSRNETWFKAIVDNRRKLQEVMDAFACHLEINEALGVVYLREHSEEIEEKLGIRMTRTRSLSALSTALILKLRWNRLQFYMQPTGDDVPIVGSLELREYLAQFSRAQIDSQFERAFRRSLEELAELQVLVAISSDGSEEESGFFEITSLCDLLLPADQIQEVRARANEYFNSTLSFEGESDAR